jgi:hypothetical protein
LAVSRVEGWVGPVGVAGRAEARQLHLETRPLVRRVAVAGRGRIAGTEPHRSEDRPLLGTAGRVEVEGQAGVGRGGRGCR